MSFLDKLFKFKKKPFGGKEQMTKSAQEKSAVAKSSKPLATSSTSHGSGKLAHVIARPHISEKTAASQAFNQYVFDVDSSIAKQDVACAVHNIYGVRPVSVRMISVSGKKVRFGRVTGNTKAWKKAIVTLPEGKTIDAYKK